MLHAKYTGATAEQCPAGRAQASTTRRTTPVERTNKPTYLPLALRQLIHSTNMLKHLIWDELRHEQNVTWECRVQWTNRRERLHRRLRNLHGIAMDASAHLGPEQALDALAPVLHQARQQHQQATKQKWHNQMAQYSTECRYVTKQQHARLDRLQLPNGEWTTDINDIDKTLCEFWQQQAIADPNQLDEVCYNSRRLIDDLIPESEYIVLETLASKDVRSTITSLRNQAASGPGCWHPTDLKSLPDLAITELTQLYVTCEARQHFPRLFAESVTTNIPKAQGKAQPADLRPITVFPLPWRVYAKLRAQQTTHLLMSKLSPHQHGAIPGSSVEDVVTNIKQAVDNCVAEMGEVHGLQVDIQKCFNGLDADIALYVLQKMGLPPCTAQLWGSHYMRHTTRHRYPGSVLGEPYAPARGIAQGDPLAVLWPIPSCPSYHIYWPLLGNIVLTCNNGGS